MKIYARYAGMELSQGRNHYTCTTILPKYPITVRSNVYLPFSEATDSAVFGGCVPYRCQALSSYVRREPRTVPLKKAVIFLLALVLFFSCCIGSRVIYMNKLKCETAHCLEQIQKTQLDNIELAKRVEEARDPARICYAAVQKLGMVSSASVEPIYVVAQPIPSPP